MWCFLPVPHIRNKRKATASIRAIIPRASPGESLVAMDTPVINTLTIPTGKKKYTILTKFQYNMYTLLVHTNI